MRYLHLGMLFRAVPLVAGCWLGANHGAVFAVMVVAGVGAVATVLGALLLRTSSLGVITWRNIVAGWLMPWCYASGSTTLVGMALTSFVAWSVLGVIGAVGWSTPWLLAAWLLDAIALGWLTGPAWRRSHGRVQKRVVRNLILVIVALAAGGLVARLLGDPLLGAAIAGGPLAAIGLLYGVYVGLFMVLRPRF